MISRPARPLPFRDDARTILDSIRRIVRSLRISSRTAERELGVSGAQLFVLQKLADCPVLSINELAERTLTHQSTVSVVVSRLVEHGLVLRTPAKNDGRRLDLSLSAKGRTFLKKAPTTAQERLIGAIQELSAAERSKLGGLLASLVARAGLAEEASELFFENEGERK